MFHAQDKGGQRAFVVKILVSHGDRKDSVELVLAIGRFVAVLLRVPGKNADLIVVVRQAVVGLGKDTKILRNVFLYALIRVFDFVEGEKSDQSLALCVLSTVERDVHV